MAYETTYGHDVIQVNGSGSFEVPVVGEQSYVQNFERIFGKRTIDGIDVQCTALLIPEPNNPYDKNAVRVLIDGILVGYLERASAKNVCASLKRMDKWGVALQVQARVKGGWYRSASDSGDFGVWLDFPSETLKSKTTK